MSGDHQGLDFSTVIASTVHDMKNSLAMLMQAHAQWLGQLPEALHASCEQGIIEYEFAHLNDLLVQLLGLYKLGINQLPLRPAYHELEDLIEEQLARHQEVLLSRGIEASYEVEAPGQLGFFDLELLGSVLANVITNSIRYARSALLIRAFEEEGQLVLSVNDDGLGYPEAMLEHEANHLLGISHSTGSTGLGLYFAARIAALHEREGVPGRIEIANGGPLGGGEFHIFLP